MKKIKLYEEVMYFIAITTLSLGVSLVAASNFGISMIVAPAYLVSLKFDALTFGLAEYVVQAFFFVAMCVALKGFKPQYLFAFITGVIYGRVLDTWRSLVPILNPAVTEPGSSAMGVRIVLFVAGILITQMSVAMFMRVYPYAQVYDFFVKAVARKYSLPVSKVKTGMDFTCLSLALILTFIFFGKIRGVGVGTLIMALINGRNIGMFNRIYGEKFDFVPIFPKLKDYFEVY